MPRRGAADPTSAAPATTMTRYSAGDKGLWDDGELIRLWNEQLAAQQHDTAPDTTEVATSQHDNDDDDDDTRSHDAPPADSEDSNDSDDDASSASSSSQQPSRRRAKDMSGATRNSTQQTPHSDNGTQRHRLPTSSTATYRTPAYIRRFNDDSSSNNSNESNYNNSLDDYSRSSDDGDRDVCTSAAEAATAQSLCATLPRDVRALAQSFYAAGYAAGHYVGKHKAAKRSRSV